MRRPCAITARTAVVFPPAGLAFCCPTSLCLPLVRIPDSLRPAPAICPAGQPTGERCVRPSVSRCTLPSLFRHCRRPRRSLHSLACRTLRRPLLSLACPLPTLSWCIAADLHTKRSRRPRPELMSAAVQAAPGARLFPLSLPSSVSRCPTSPSCPGARSALRRAAPRGTSRGQFHHPACTWTAFWLLLTTRYAPLSCTTYGSKCMFPTLLLIPLVQLSTGRLVRSQWVGAEGQVLGGSSVSKGDRLSEGKNRQVLEQRAGRRRLHPSGCCSPPAELRVMPWAPQWCACLAAFAAWLCRDQKGSHGK